MRTGPDYIQFYPTLQCNQSCEFCFNRAMPSQPDMTLKDFQAMLAVLKQGAVRTIDIMGGEPTLHPEIVNFVRESLASGFYVNISSNGTNLNVLDEIMGMGNGVTVGISVNDKETLESTKGFIQTRKPVVKSIFRTDMDCSMIEKILALRPKRFYLIYRDALNLAELGKTAPFHEFSATIENRFDSRETGSVSCSGFLPDRESSPELAQVRCPAGTTKLGIMPDGSVYPCNLFFGRKEFLLGNVKNDPFQNIWQHPALAYFRSTAKNPCTKTSCRHHAGCHGGCPAHSLFLADDLTASDPRCNSA